MNRYYKGILTKTGKGSFSNSGQKAGKKGAIKAKPAKEKMAIDPVQKRLRKISRGLFHAKQANPMRAQLNG